MASGGHLMLQQRAVIEAKIKTLINSDLKEICKAYNAGVTGTKAVLQKKCMDILKNAVEKGDAVAFEDMRYRTHNRGQSRPSGQLDSPATAYATSTGGHHQYPMHSGRGSAMPTSNRLPTGGKYFKQSPFYEIVDTVLPLQDITEVPQARHTVKADIQLSPEHCQGIIDQGMRLMMYCGIAQGMSPYTPVDIAFPNQVEVKVNDDDVKSNFKGLKNKPGSTKPADLTDKFRTRPPGYRNQISITYALTTKRYAYIIYLVRHISAETLAERIRSANVIPKRKVLDEMNRANADPDIEATSTRMSLKDPISTVRISLPVRSTVCTHNQCFDGGMFLQMMEQAPVWNCPVCNKVVSFQSLCVDKYFEDILNNTAKSVEKVDVEPNGEWNVIKEEEDEHLHGASNKPRASYDDDFDDDLVEVADPTNKQINGLKRESQPVNTLSPMAAFNTPPLSSREPSVAQSTASVQRAGNKRGAGAIIDLTVSDEEDEPPRPAKRQHMAPHSRSKLANPANSYHTPSSVPDRSHYQPPPPPRQADNYRPMSRAGPPPPPSPHNMSLFPTAVPSNPQSPVLPKPPYRPSGSSWPAQQHSRPPSQSYGSATPFGSRPPLSPGGLPQASPGLTNDGRWGLPPIQPHPQQDAYAFGGWRSDRESNYSNSPG